MSSHKQTVVQKVKKLLNLKRCLNFNTTKKDDKKTDVNNFDHFIYGHDFFDRPEYYQRDSEGFATDNSIDIYNYPILVTTPERVRNNNENKLTSTVIHTDSQQIVNQNSPTLSLINETDNKSSDFQNFEDVSNAYVNYFYESPKLKHKALFSQMNDDDNQIYICCKTFITASPTELGISYSDRLKLIQKTEGSELCLVQNIVTCQYGFVPINNIIEMQKFLKLF
jgi:hypothetical protein